MARFSRMDVLNTTIDQGLVPVFYNADPQVAVDVARACAAGGGRLLEFTNRGDAAIDVFKELVQRCRQEAPDMIVGVGTIYDAPTAALFIAQGANFVVGPIFNEEVARFCNRRKIPYMPGCGSATEISVAEEWGSEIVKVFPANSVGGPAFVKALLGPSPWSRIMPTGEVDASREGVATWFKAGVTAIGVGSQIIKKDLLAARDYAAIGGRARETLGFIREAHGK